jgi:putative transposase
MKAAGVVPLVMRKKKFAYSRRVTTTEANDKLPEKLRNNLLRQGSSTAQYPHHIWAEDFTYLKCQNKMYYLATVLDIYGRQIVGWALSAHHDTGLIQAALLDAVSKYQSPTILHNDQGTEYCSKKYYALCVSLEIQMSFSDKASPWQNGFQESFYREFKLELDAKHLDRFECPGELAEAIARQLHYYNTSRVHTALKTNPAAYAAGFARDNIKSKISIQQITTGVRDRVLQKVGA